MLRGLRIDNACCNAGSLLTTDPIAGTKDARERDLADLVRLAGSQLGAEGPAPPAIEDDLRHGEELIAGAMTKGSWARIKGWALSSSPTRASRALVW